MLSMKWLAFFSFILFLTADAPKARAFWFFGSSTIAIPIFNLAIKGRGFSPQELLVPSGKKFKLVVSNENLEPSEFESFSLHREQVVGAHSKITVFLGPLQPGKYDFFDDFHSHVNGTLKASPSPTRQSQ